jgi:predicted PurR-regulated permease PerM
MNTKINLTFKDYIAIILLIIAICIVYFSDVIIQRIQDLNTGLDNSQKVSQDIAKLVLSLDKISLDTNILNTPYLQNIRPLPQFPMDLLSPFVFGKNNPFSGGFTTVAPQATTTSVGAVQYAIQRDQGTASVRTVNINQVQRR